MPMTKDAALSSLDECESLVQTFGAPDADSLQRMKRVVFRLESGPLRDGYLREKTASLRSWAEDGFSTRKFEKYNGGLMQVRVWALSDIDTIRNLVEKHWPE